ncbi:MAG: hypothetical protein ACK4MS_11230 [Paracoccaceae bacterium]
MRAVIWAVLLTVSGLAGRVAADPVEVTIIAILPEGATERPVSWSALPMNLPPDADVLAALIMTPEPVSGPWRVGLEPGEYLISGFSDVDLYEGNATITKQTTTLAIPVLQIDHAVPFRCADTATCDFTDEATGLGLTLPQGWAMDLPYHADLGDGELAPEISAVFFEDVEDDGAGVWFLNPVDWIIDDNGPCRAVAIGNLCTFEVSAAAEAAFSVIAPSLRVVE